MRNQFNSSGEGLRKTYLQAPYLKGNVYSETQESNRLCIEWSDDDQGPDLQEIDVPDDMPSYSTLKNERAPLHLFQARMCPVDVKPDHSTADSRAAVFAASFSRLDGGLIVCVCVHHNVMDGTGVGFLIGVLANNTRSDALNESSHIEPAEPLTRLTRLLGFAASTFGSHDILSRDDLVSRHPEFAFPSTSSSSPSNAAVPKQTPKATSRIFAFPASRIDAAKSLLSSVMKPELLTTYNILSTLAWSCITRIRSLRVKASVSRRKLGFAINGRKHLGKELLDQPYLGNVNLFGLAILPDSGLDAASKCIYSHQQGTPSVENLRELIPVICAVSSAVSRVSSSYIAEVISLVEATPNVLDISPGWSAWNGPDLTLTSWANLGLYECDFGDGIGRPEFVRVPYAEFDGLVIILPRCRAKGAERVESEGQPKDEMIEMVVMLSRDDMEALERDEVWRSWTLN